MDLSVWQESLMSAMTTLWTKLAEYVPNLASAILVLVIGFFVSKLVQRAAIKLLVKLALDKASEKVGVHETFARVGIQKKSSEVLGVIVFWLFMLTFVITAAESLKLENVTRTIDAFVLYLPNVLAAALIFVLGLMFSNFVSNLVRNASDRVGLDYSKVLGKIVHTVLLIVVSVLAIGQLQIETGLLNDILSILLISGGAVLALSIGLGTRDLSKNILSGIYAREQFKEGSKVEVENQNGTVKEVGTVSTLISKSDGKIVHIPNSTLLNSVVTEERK